MAKRKLSDLGDAPEQTVRQTRSQKHKPRQEQEQAASDKPAPAAPPSNLAPDIAEDAPKKQQSLCPPAASGAAQAQGGAEPLYQPRAKPCQPLVGSPAAGSSPSTPAQSSNGSSSSVTASVAESVQATRHPTCSGHDSRVWPSGAAGSAVVASGVFAEEAGREAEESRDDPTVQALSQEATTLQLAQGLLAGREFDRCLVVLHTAQQLRGRHPTLMTLTAICRAQKYGVHHEWFKVLGLEPQAEPQLVRKRYKQLAALVHPDKCSLPLAEEAFKLLGQAVAQIASTSQQGDTAEGGFVAGSGPDGTNWWEAWEGADEERAKKKAMPSSQPTMEDKQEDAELVNMKLEALQAEVNRRQAAVLKPQPGSPEADMSPFRRQKRVRVARTALANKVNAVPKQAGRGW